MPQRLWVVPALGLGLVFSTMSWGNQQPDTTKERAKLLQTQLEAARNTFDALWSNEGINNGETLYLWSRRWLEVERQVQDKKQDQAAAVKTHLDRMKQLQRRTNKLFQEKLMTREQISAADYFVAEAEMWVLQAR
jgi:hypothetical protein